MHEIELRSDNSAGVAPEIMAALAAANVGSDMAYGDDPITHRLEGVVREVFEHPTARVFPVTSGTAGNSLALSALCPPWGAVLCHETAHVLNSECGATSMLGGGAVLRGVAGDDFRVQPDRLRDALAAVRWDDPHHSQPAVLSLTQPTDLGTVYDVAEVSALTAIAAGHGLRAHLDGARFANALVALGCTPADVTWRAGIDVMTLGATKNGAMSAEAIVSFDERASAELVYRTKRAGHVTSKMRYQSAQLVAWLTDGCWLRLAANANAQARRLATGLRELGFGLVAEPAVNLLFVEVADEEALALQHAGLRFYGIRPGVIRLVTSWQTTDDDVEAALAAFAALGSPASGAR